MQSAHPSLVIINVFQMTGLLCRTYYLNEQETKYVCIYTNNEDLKPHAKIGTSSGHAVLNEIQWFILVTFKSDISKIKCTNLVTRNIPCQCTVDDIYAFTSENTQLYLSKKDWSQLMELASGCVEREVIKFGRLQNELFQWHKCVESKSFCTPPDKNAIFFNTL